MVPIDYFDTAADLYAERCAIVDGPVRLSFGELARMSRRVAHAIAGHRRSDEPVPVAVYAPNDYRVLAAMLGIMRAGAVIAPLHPENAIAVSRQYVQAVKPRCFFYHSSLAPHVRQLKADAPSVAEWVCLDAEIDSDRSFDAIVAGAEEYVDDWIDASGNTERPVYLWATSGSTGAPKVVVDTVATFDSMLKVMRSNTARLADRHVTLVFSPMSHVSGPHCFVMLTLGATIVVMRAFDAREVFKNVEQYRVTDMFVPPTALYLLLACPEARQHDVSSLVNVRLGVAAVAPEKLREAVRLFGPCVSQTYSQIETGFVTTLEARTIAACVDGDRIERLKSSGRSMFVNRFAIMSEDGRVEPRGATGEVVVRGVCVKRYLDPDATAGARRFGWHHTGDLGYIDEDGFLYIVGRIKDVINMAGFKVAAAEIEEIIMELPEVLECAVVPVPDPIRGEVAQAIVTLRPERALSNQAILRHCRRRLGQGKAPAFVEQWDMLPKSPAGKVDKLQIRGMLTKPRATISSATIETQPADI